MRITFLAILVISSLSVNLFAFEGEIQIKYHQSNGAPQIDNASWFFKGELSKFQLSMKNDKGILMKSTFIPDKKSNSMLIFSDLKSEDEKNYFYNVPLKNVSNDNYDNSTAIEVEKTGSFEKINTYVCQKILLKTKQNITEIWVAESLDIPFANLVSFFRANKEMQALQNVGMNGFPLKSQTKDLQGKILFEYEVMSIQSKSLSISDFKVPAGFIDAAKRE